MERGAEAAPASEALAGLLTDDRTCIPASRALERIGAPAAAAIGKLDEMAKHRDGFVRLAAVYALKSVGTPTGKILGTTEPVVDILRRTLLDDYHPVTKVSGDALISYGPAAAAAIPEVKQLKEKRQYALYIWPYSDFPDMIIAAIAPDQ